MTFQAYIDNIEAKTGKTPEDFWELARTEGLLESGVKAGAIVALAQKGLRPRPRPRHGNLCDVQETDACRARSPVSWIGHQAAAESAMNSALGGRASVASIALVLFTLVGAPASSAGMVAGDPIIYTEDVTRFFEVYDAAHGHPTAEELQHEYIDPGSPGLHHLAEIRHVTGDTIAKALGAHPEIFSDARRCMAVLPRVRPRVSAALRTLGILYPKAVFPRVTIAISRGKPVGVADSAGVIIGLEALCAVNYLNPNIEDRFVHTIAHEYTHVEQARQSPALYNNPKPTVLDSSLIEGAADFTAVLIAREGTFHSPYAPSGPARKEIEVRFVADEDETDLSQWIDNGTLQDPGDLGYWVGYRIVKAYYQHAADKRKALRDILEMKDPKTFIAKSHWYPGIRLR
jgi:hypothetical protein